MAGGKTSQGAEFRAGDGATSEAFVAVAYVTGIDGLKPSRNFADTTCLASSGAWSESVATTVEGGSVDIDLNFEADAATQLAEYQTKFNAGSLNNYQILFTDTGASTVTFGAYVESYSINQQQGDKASASVTFKITGLPTWA